MNKYNSRSFYQSFAWDLSFVPFRIHVLFVSLIFLSFDFNSEIPVGRRQSMFYFRMIENQF